MFGNDRFRRDYPNGGYPRHFGTPTFGYLPACRAIN
jgi:hypothetical protein